MSLFGEPFDSLITILGNIMNGIGGLVAGLLAIIGKLLTIIYYIFFIIEIFIGIVTNPYLLACLILGTGFYYAAFTAKSRKELIIKLGVYYKYVGEGLIKVVYGIYTIVVAIIHAITEMIP